MTSFKVLGVSLLLACILVSFSEAIKLPQNPDPNPKPLSWWQEEIIYQVYPRSHQDSDGDGVGDLKGIESRLDHFVELGVGGVWISPFYKSPMADFGYDISDFREVDPIFGTMADFERLSSAMKQRGLKVIMDYVPNHSSDQHEWFGKSIRKEGKYTDYYVWRDSRGTNETSGEPLPPNNWLSVFGGSAWQWNEDRQQFYLHQFTSGQPDLNFENEEVVKEMLDNVRFWIMKGVDGFRVDAVPHMFEDQRFLDEPLNPDAGDDTLPTDHSYLNHIYTYNLPGVFEVLAQFRKLIDIYSLSDGVERVMFVEATNPSLDEVFEYYGTPEKPIAHFPFNFEFIGKVKSGFNGTNIADVVDGYFTKMPQGNWANWLLGNHDNGRVASRFGAQLVDPFNMMLLLLPGNAVTYYGEEIGMLDAEISWQDTVDPPGCSAGPDRYTLFSRDPERTPMQWDDTNKNAGFSTADKTWLPMHPNWRTTNVKLQKESQGLTHLKVYKEMAKLRHTDVWRYGALESKAMMNGALFGFTRIYNDEGFIYIANFGNNEATVDLNMEFENIPALAKVYMTSVGFTPNIPAIGETLRTEAVRVGANHSIVLAFPIDFVAPTQPTQPTEPTTVEPTEPTTEEDGEGPSTENGGGEEEEGNKDSGSSSMFNSVQNLFILVISVVAVYLQF